MLDRLLRLELVQGQLHRLQPVADVGVRQLSNHAYTTRLEDQCQQYLVGQALHLEVLLSQTFFNLFLLHLGSFAEIAFQRVHLLSPAVEPSQL